MSEKRRLMVRYLNRLEEISPGGYQVGLHIRFAKPMFLRSTYPDEWQAHYSRNNMALRDPLVFWGVSTTGCTRWSAISLPDPFGVMQQAADFGLKFGAVASCGKITSRTIVGVARADREFTDNELAEVRDLADALHDTAEAPDSLPVEQVEALRLLAQGFSDETAAEEVGISQAAMKSLLAIARESMGAPTMSEAIRMAKEYRLI